MKPIKFIASLPITALTLAALVGTTSLSFAKPTPANLMAQMEKASPSSALPFKDISKNVYKSDILKGFELKIVEGFPDGTFRPNQPVTREQAVSMIVDAINLITPVDLEATPTQTVRPFTDVPSDRWSAKKIAWAQWNIWPAGTPTGKFRPTDNITRAELVTFLRRAAERTKVKLGRSPALTATQPPIKFSDVSGFNKQLTMQMSAYCRVASPLNEKGKQFAPNKAAHRDYTTAALVRMLTCVRNDTK